MDGEPIPLNLQRLYALGRGLKESPHVARPTLASGLPDNDSLEIVPLVLKTLHFTTVRKVSISTEILIGQIIHTSTIAES